MTSNRHPVNSHRPIPATEPDNGEIALKSCPKTALRASKCRFREPPWPQDPASRAPQMRQQGGVGLGAQKKRRGAKCSWALQSLQVNCSVLDVSAENRPLGIDASFRVHIPPKYRFYGLSDPTLPLAVSSALWISLSRLGRLLFSVRSIRLSSSSAFLQSITQLTLADPPQQISSSLGLPVPSAHARIEGPLFAGLPSPLRCAFRVWLPS